jgi:hypothetical protein
VFRSLVARRTIAGASLVLGLVALAAGLPPFAIIGAWPFLFVLPGWWLVARASPDLSPVGRMGVAIVASIYLSAHLVNLAGTLAGGVSRTVILTVTAILALATVILAAVPLPGLAPPPRRDARAVVSAVRDHLPAWAVAGAGALVVGVVLWFGAWHLVGDQWVSGGWNWSDFLVHVSIGTSTMAGNFPPQVPYFAGVPLTYHWFADFHGGIAAILAGIDVIPVFELTNALMAATLGLVTWELARRLTGSRGVATLAAVLVLFSGGMGYLRLPIDLAAGKGDLWTLVSQGSYDNTWNSGWPFFRIPSVLGTGLFAHRATALGLPGLVAVVVLVDASLGRRPAGMLLAGILAALLAPFHFFAFPATYLVVLFLVVARKAWRDPTWTRDAALFLAPVLLALPFVVGPLLQQRDRGALQFVTGWESAPWKDGALAVVFFYATNLGLPFAIAVLAALRRDLPSRGLLIAWIAGIFVIPNVIVVSAIAFDMNKYFQVMWIAVAIAAAWAIVRLPRPVIAAVLALSVLSPALVAVWHIAGQTPAMTAAQERAGRWIATNTPQRSVFVTDAWIDSPVDLSGRLRLTTYGPYAANLGYDPEPRAVDVKTIYCEGDQRAVEVMAKYGATYVLSAGGVLECPSGSPTDFRESDRFETVYDAGGVAIFRLRSASP